MNIQFIVDVENKLSIPKLTAENDNFSSIVEDNSSFAKIIYFINISFIFEIVNALIFFSCELFLVMRFYINIDICTIIYEANDRLIFVLFQVSLIEV